jgi:hypothetical protein
MSQKEVNPHNAQTDLADGSQLGANKTYSPKLGSHWITDSYSPELRTGNYQPVVPATTEQPTPPTGGSGMPAANSTKGSTGPSTNDKGE